MSNTKPVTGTAIEIHTEGRANYKMIFATQSTDDLILKMSRDKLIKQVGASGFEFECISNEAFNLIIKTSAK